MNAPNWKCYYCGREVICDTEGAPMDWENEEGDAGPLLAFAVCEDWPKCAHPHYGPCDGFGPGGRCSECRRPKMSEAEFDHWLHLD